MVRFRTYLRHRAKNRAILTYTRKLPELLPTRYGNARFYTPQQVRKTVESAGLGTEFSCYAVAIFSSRESFDLFHRDLGEDCDYDAMRADVANIAFDGNVNFNVSISPEANHDFGHSGAHAAGGADHSGNHDHH
jgi:hypothetical protein